MLFLRNRTEPSPKTKFAPPGCRLTKPLAAEPKRHPSGAEDPCQLSLQGAMVGGKVLEFQPRGTVMPWTPPFWNQKLLSAARLGRCSPATMVLLVPSRMEAMVGGGAV